LCEHVTFIGYLCEIYSMCENMVIWYLGSISEVCAVSEVLCSVSDRHYTESGNSTVSDEEKGRHANTTRALYLTRKETRPRNACLVSEKKRDTPMQRASPFYLTCTKKEYLQIILHRMPLAPTHCMLVDTHMRTYVCQQARCTKHRVEHKLSDILEAIRLLWV
jgi:hypothetical protein